MLRHHGSALRVDDVVEALQALGPNTLFAQLAERPRRERRDVCVTSFDVPNGQETRKHDELAPLHALFRSIAWCRTMAPMESRALAELAFFRALAPDDLARILALCSETRFQDGETILEEGVRPIGLYIVTKGGVRVSSGGKRRDGYARLGEGAHFGETSLVTDLPTAATVRAEGEVVCIHLPRESFRALLDEDAKIAREVLRAFVDTLARRLDRSDRSLASVLRRKERFAAFAHLAALAWMQTRIALTYLWVFFRTKLIRWKMSAEAMSRVHRKSARRFKETAARLKGANVKVGQIASMQQHVLPKEYIEELKSLRDTVGATDYSLIAGVIQSELGLRPFELFEEFDKVPIAAASMAQVHVAKLRTGEKVVVKVQHPGLERSVAIDLALMRLLFSVIALFVKRIDFRQVLSEAEEPLRRELDLHLEGKATEALGAELRPLGVVVPKVHWQYTSRRVITLEYIDGVNVDDVDQMKAWNVDRRTLMETYFRAFWHQAFGGGLFHADPHPGNVFCTRDGRLAMLDFGMVKRLPDNVRSGLQKELFGGVFNQPTLYVDGLIEKGAMREPDRARVEAWAKKMFTDPKMRSMLFDHRIEEGAEMTDLFGSLFDMVDGLETFETPQDNLMFMRALGIVIDVCKEVVPEVPPSHVAMPVLIPSLTEFLGKHPEYAEAAMATMIAMQAAAADAPAA
jgi:predicted unusual protein kinase regulating ubiquinone biosynthesis (AarF/ABC1/UbiB family)